jgi:hypothetical protein
MLPLFDSLTRAHGAVPKRVCCMDHLLVPHVTQAHVQDAERGSWPHQAVHGAATQVWQRGCPLARGVALARGEGLDRGSPVSPHALALLCASTLSSLSLVATSSGDTHSL